MSLPRHTDLSQRLAKKAIDKPLIVAHRGDPITYPENTLAAFRCALDQGADLVELDIRQSADGHLVVIHDETVDRTTDSEAHLGRTGVLVSSLSLAELEGLDAGTWRDSRHRGLSIPSLEAAMNLIQDQAITMIEHKDGEASQLVALLRQASLVNAVIVQSLDWEWLRAVHRAEPKIMIAALGKGACGRERLEELEGTGACMLHWRYQDLSTEAIDMMASSGHLTCAYTVDSERSMIDAVHAGLSAITTNYPGQLRALIDSGSARRRR